MFVSLKIKLVNIIMVYFKTTVSSPYTRNNITNNSIGICSVLL